MSYTDFVKVQSLMTRDRINDFLRSLGLDPNEIAEMHFTPRRVIVTRFLVNEDGTRVLDHLGPRTAETYFTIK